MDNTKAEISDGTFRMPLSNVRYTPEQVAQVFEALERIAQGDCELAYDAKRERADARKTLRSIRGFV